jgi:glycosyltransferase involved in cell wall biosynthesis
MSRPQISIVMSVYNSRRFIDQAVESVLEQSFEDFEFIIIDDGSSDDSMDIVRSYGDERIRIIENEGNLGLTASLNRGIESARGDYIARIDADDVWVNYKLDVQIDYMKINPGVGVCGTLANIIDEKGEIIRKTNFPARHKAIIWSMIFVNPISHSSVMAKTELTKKNRYNENIKKSQDYELWSRLSPQTRINNIPERLVSLRRHSETISNTQSGEQLSFALKIANDHICRIFGHDFRRDGFEIFISGKANTITELYSAKDFINRAYKEFLIKYNPDSAEKSEIKREYAVRLGALALPYVKKPSAWTIVFSIFVKRPGIIFDYLNY